nr:hypothetical protein [uncultured Desulfobulbus sp.]
MIRTVLPLFLILISSTVNAKVVTCQLHEFIFDDGGKGYGSFAYDTLLQELKKIEISTTNGSDMNGRSYIAVAGAWGSHSEDGHLAFTDTSSEDDYKNAGWLRISIKKFPQENNLNTKLELWPGMSAESYCVNSDCSSAANDITDPKNSRDVTSGYIICTNSEFSLKSYPIYAWRYLKGKFNSMLQYFNHLKFILETM